MMGKKRLEMCKKLLCESQKPYIWEQTFCGVMKIGLQYSVSSAICYLVDYPLSSVKCTVLYGQVQCSLCTGQDKDLLVSFCVPKGSLSYTLYSHTYTIPGMGCPILTHHPRSELSYTLTMFQR